MDETNTLKLDLPGKPPPFKRGITFTSLSGNEMQEVLAAEANPAEFVAAGFPVADVQAAGVTEDESTILQVMCIVPKAVVQLMRITLDAAKSKPGAPVLQPVPVLHPRQVFPAAHVRLVTRRALLTEQIQGMLAPIDDVEEAVSTMTRGLLFDDATEAALCGAVSRLRSADGPTIADMAIIFEAGRQVQREIETGQYGRDPDEDIAFEE